MNRLKETDFRSHGRRPAPTSWPGWKHMTMSLVAIFLTSTVWGATPPTGVPANAVNSANHYRDSGLGPATGRSGNATLNVRALLDKSGNTLVELATGGLDTATVLPGNLDKVQYKPFDPNGNAYFAQNFTGLSGGGYFKFTTNGVQRSQQMQLQANVSGIDKRTDVVTVVETVKLRPDITIARLTNPDQAYVNQPVVISATVRELNGDTGANTDCVLSVNGSVADTASTIWVDAGGVVSCAFAYRFPSEGNYQLQVSANTVVPADWDTSNNSSTGSINIVNPGSVKLSGWAGYWHDDFTLSSTDAATVYQNGTQVQNYQNTFSWSGWVEVSEIHGYVFGSKPIQYPATVSYQESSDGVVTYNDAITVLGYSRTWQDGSNNTCSLVYGSGWYGGLETDTGSTGCVDPVGNVVGSLYSYVNTWRHAGDVTYLSNGYQCGYWGGGWNQVATAPSCSTGNYYTWNTSTKSQWGTHVAAGSQHAISAVLTGADGTNYSTNSGSFAIQSSQFTYGPYNWAWTYGPDDWGYSATFYRNNLTDTESWSSGYTYF